MANGVKGRTILQGLFSGGPIGAGIAAGIVSTSGDQASPFYRIQAGVVPASQSNPWAVSVAQVSPSPVPVPSMAYNFTTLEIILGIVIVFLLLE